MSDLVTELSERARKLTPEDRARLAEKLLASLEGNLEPEVDTAWVDELRKRVAEVERGGRQARSRGRGFCKNPSRPDVKLVRFHPEAEAKLTAEVKYYDEHSPGLGEQFFRKIQATVQLPSVFPMIGAPHGTLQSSASLTGDQS